MDSFAFAAPILPGKTEEARAWAAQVKGPRSAEMDASRTGIGITRETDWLWSTPMGDFLIVLLEGEDVAKANAAFAASQDPYDAWFKDTVKSFTGIDFGDPLPAMPEVLFDYRGS
jgi:hypothetical protein